MFGRKRFSRRPVTGPMGPQGIAGPTGPKGEPGTPLGHYVPEFISLPAQDLPEGLHAQLPRHAHGADAAMDLYSLEAVSVRPGQTVRVRTGVAIKDPGLPVGVAGEIRSRSGLASHGVVVLGGLIDPGYTGELVVILHNLGRKTWTANAGTRVAQFLTFPAYTGRNETSRGTGGLGSTGLEDTAVDNENETVPAAGHGEDLVNRPAHYTDHAVFSGQAWDYTRRMGFSMGNAFKYGWRAGSKGDIRQDLEKARWYLTHAETALDLRVSLAASRAAKLHGELSQAVQDSAHLRRYFLNVDLDRKAVPMFVLSRLDSAERRVIAQAEAWTACVHIAERNPARALAAIHRALQAVE